MNSSFIEDFFSQEEKEEWSLNSTAVNYAAGQVLFYEGTNPFGIFILLKGKVKRYKTGDSGKSQIFQICTNGDMFGFRPVLSDVAYPDGATALEACQVLFISKQTFLSILKKNPTLCFSFLTEMSKEFGKLIELKTILAQQPVRERVALVLCSLVELYQSNSISFSRQDLADMSGTVPETFVRMIREFKDSGSISSSGRLITVLDTLALKKISNTRIIN
jgi:CRP-like cAMP-binding protein